MRPCAIASKIASPVAGSPHWPQPIRSPRLECGCRWWISVSSSVPVEPSNRADARTKATSSPSSAARLSLASESPADVVHTSSYERAYLSVSSRSMTSSASAFSSTATSRGPGMPVRLTLVGPLLVDDQIRLGSQAQHLARLHQVQVLLVKELEAVVAVALPAGELAVLRDLVRLVAEAVDVDHQRNPGMPLELVLVLDHVAGEAMHHEQLLRQIVAADQSGQPARDLVDGRGVGGADLLRRQQRRLHAPLGVERQADVRLAQPALQRLRLLEERRVAGLDVEQQQHLVRPRHPQVAPDRRVVLAYRVVPAVAGLAGHDRGDQLEGGQDRPPGARVWARLPLEPAGRAPPRADPEGAELVVLRRPVVRHHPTARQDLAAAARQLRALRLGARLRLPVVAPAEGE